MLLGTEGKQTCDSIGIDMEEQRGHLDSDSLHLALGFARRFSFSGVLSRCDISNYALRFGKLFELFLLILAQLGSFAERKGLWQLVVASLQVLKEGIEDFWLAILEYNFVVARFLSLMLVTSGIPFVLMLRSL
jgi:hypothetical protein